MENFRPTGNNNGFYDNNNPMGWKKAKNPFFCFLQDFREQYYTGCDNKRVKATELSQAAGEKWRQMSEDEKLLYKIWALKNREEIRHINANYFTYGPQN